ncbi:uncharacterized protein LOC123716438 [Pieris brassicae]|uniref:uncharacterized protein LOC123716438 n=1 Tax=Pieris brassicae TaxID=7116 RepID=UPI001E661859|nr:uncharacterized protein LOC123716438 [Pieris brassicae]
MDLKGPLVNTNLRIYPSLKLIEFIKTIPVTKEVPGNIVTYIKSENKTSLDINYDVIDTKQTILTETDYNIINKIKTFVESDETSKDKDEIKENVNYNKDASELEDRNDAVNIQIKKEEEEVDVPFLTTSDLDWLYIYLKSKHDKGEKAPYLHALLQSSEVKVPQNKILKRNPDLEARCVKLRAQQEAREYRKMTKGVDNVRIRYPEDSISYQIKQLNRHLIAIGQFLLSIFAGFLFGFRGVEWIVGNLDFGFRLLLGVMCALVIALAEIYFLAKKLNEELSVPETVQLGGPVKFGNEVDYVSDNKNAITKEHQD